MELNEDNKEKLFNYFDKGELEQWVLQDIN
jgi:hypothetical protein